MADLRRGKLRSELLEWLRIEHGLSSPIVWTVGIELDPQNALPESLYEQETILGDFLRTVREFEADPQQPLPVESLLAEGQEAAAVFPGGRHRRRHDPQAGLARSGPVGRGTFGRRDIGMVGVW